jgi:hypothetical protein
LTPSNLTANQFCASTQDARSLPSDLFECDNF